MAEGVKNNGRVQRRLPRVLVVDVGGTNLKEVGGRITGRYWYNTAYGGAPNRL